MNIMDYERTNFTNEELQQAKETSLTALAQAMGYTVKRIGTHHYTIKEMDSIVIYDDRTWNRFSKVGNINGGSQIDFLMEFAGCNMVEAVHKLLNFQGISTNYSPTHVAKPREVFVNDDRKMDLPEKFNGSYKRTYAYLIKQRDLSADVINYFVKDLKLIYEDTKYHNMIFLGKDKDGNIRYAAKKGTCELNGKSFRGDVLGNDKNYGVNIVNKKSNELNVFEAVLDAMSYIDITGDYYSNILVLGGVADNPLKTFLEEHPHIKKINFRLDRDQAGDKALFGAKEIRDDSGKITQCHVESLLKKYAKLGYSTSDSRIPKIDGVKDFNDYLKFLKKNYPDKVYAGQDRKVHRKRKAI